MLSDGKQLSVRQPEGGWFTVYSHSNIVEKKTFIYIGVDNENIRFLLK